MALTNIQTGVTATLTTKGGTNWNMLNATLYVDALDLPAGEVRLFLYFCTLNLCFVMGDFYLLLLLFFFFAK